MPPAEHAIDELEERVLLRLPVVAFIPQPPGGARRVLTCLGAFHPRPERRSQLLRAARRIGDGGIAEHWREQRLSRRSAEHDWKPREQVREHLVRPEDIVVHRYRRLQSQPDVIRTGERDHRVGVLGRMRDD